MDVVNTRVHQGLSVRCDRVRDDENLCCQDAGAIYVNMFTGFMLRYRLHFTACDVTTCDGYKWYCEQCVYFLPH